MMKSVYLFCFHLEESVTAFSFFDIGKQQPYWDEVAQAKKFETQYQDRDQHTWQSLFLLLSQHNFKAALYISGNYLERLAQISPETITEIGLYVKKKQLLLLGGTYHFSLAGLFSEALFTLEVKRHKDLLISLWGIKPTIFLNTYGLYKDTDVSILSHLGFDAAITAGLNWHLAGRTTDQVFLSINKNFKLLLLPHETFHQVDEPSFELQLYHTSEEIPWEKIQSAISSPWLLSEVLSFRTASEFYRVPQAIGLPYKGQDLVSYTENPMQREIIFKIKYLEERLLRSENEMTQLILSRLTAFSHFVQLQKGSHEAPYELYLYLMNILTDIEISLLKLPLA
ncbi:hypothetical protein [Penaeicola halotolerans]|uniref:hypothetical protein n=1 Tax=Penaeicola halotolerans TaxID=2793196 RepID=UPI001CF91BB5|nr:hypothetical protein [Penaeicola halotolerans]